MLPEPLRHASSHGGLAHFPTHEFIDALVHGRKPAVDVYEALAYTAQGIVAHQSALKGGQLMKIPSLDPHNRLEIYFGKTVVKRVPAGLK